MAGLPDAVVDRAQEIADALSGKADLEEQVPLKRKLAKVAPAAQLSFLQTE
jgi:DNA mismatch repair ATPase MutS